MVSMALNRHQVEELPFDPFDSHHNTINKSRDGSLSDAEFESLLSSTETFDDELRQLQTRYIVLVGGRLGLRRGEMAHMRKKWVDFDGQFIDIPHFDPCDKGRDGDICGDCKQKAKQMADHNEGLAESEALEVFWKPKTLQAARKVPYSFDSDCVEIVESFFNRFDQYFASGNSINRWLNKTAERTDGLSTDSVTPHNLRSTAATYHAMNGLDTWSLQQMMGWVYPVTAEKYVKSNSGRTKAALENLYSE